jgi:hypothetical protein
MNDNDKRQEIAKRYEPAISFLSSQIAKGRKTNDNKYPLSRGDIMILIMLIDQDMKTDPSAALNRLAAIREKLGDLVFDAPEMSKEEAQLFR